MKPKLKRLKQIYGKSLKEIAIAIQRSEDWTSDVINGNEISEPCLQDIAAFIGATFEDLVKLLRLEKKYFKKAA